MSVRRVVFAAAIVCLGVAGTTPSAQAFGDKCCPEIRARGEVRGSMRDAMNSAIAAWERKVMRQRGAGFADWYYSGDRQIDCGWDASGTRIRCSAVASPCGRRR